jgi:hypothetical protein
MYDDDGYDDHDDGFGDYLACLAEDGRAWCNYHEATYDLTPSEAVDKYGCPESYDDPGCPNCARMEEVRERVEAGEMDSSAICFACEGSESETEFMGQRVCMPCYSAIAEGKVKRDRLRFAFPGGNSALRAAGPGNPRVHPCPNCRAPNRLTPQDRERGYQCDTCADRAEGRYGGGDY